MKTIYKYRIEYGVTHLTLPKGAIVRHFDKQNRDNSEDQKYDLLWIWAEIDKDNPPEDRHFALYGTGHQISDSNAIYIGSVLTEDEFFVWHLYEITA